MMRNNGFYMFKRILSVILAMSVLLMMTPVRGMTADSAEVTHEHNGITFTPWDDATDLPTVAGNYNLTTDINVIGAWNVNDNINLCLNGHTITKRVSASAPIVVEHGQLNIYDCQKYCN